MTSPDTSAAEVVAWRVRQQMYPETRWGRWSVYDYKPNWSDEPSVEYDALVPKSLLDTSHAETAAANARAEALERDFRDALAVAEPWHNSYEVQLARADAAEAELAKLRAQPAVDSARAELVERLRGAAQTYHLWEVWESDTQVSLPVRLTYAEIAALLYEAIAALAHPAPDRNEVLEEAAVLAARMGRTMQPKDVARAIRALKEHR